MSGKIFKRSIGVGFAFVFVFFAVACSASPQPQPPLGIYANSHAPNGSEKLTLLQGGRYTLGFLDDNTEIKGAYTTTKDQVVFTEDPGGSCPGIPGTYKWTLDGSVITWTVVSDGCTARISDWLSKPWTRLP